MNLTNTHRHGQYRLIAFSLCFLFLTTGWSFFKQEPEPGESPDLSQPSQSPYSAPMERLNSGFTNVLSGPIEIVNYLREEVKRTDPVRGFLPGVIQGVTWGVVREAVGIFEMLTFFAPWKPHLEPVDVDWLAA